MSSGLGTFGPSWQETIVYNNNKSNTIEQKLDTIFTSKEQYKRERVFTNKNKKENRILYRLSNTEPYKFGKRFTYVCPRIKLRKSIDGYGLLGYSKQQQQQLYDDYKNFQRLPVARNGITIHNDYSTARYR